MFCHYVASHCVSEGSRPAPWLTFPMAPKKDGEPRKRARANTAGGMNVDAEGSQQGAKQVQYGVTEGKEAHKSLTFKTCIRVQPVIFELREALRGYQKAGDCLNLRTRNQHDAQGLSIADRYAHIVLAAKLKEIDLGNPIINPTKLKMVPENFDIRALVNEIQAIVVKSKPTGMMFGERMKRTEATDQTTEITYNFIMQISGLAGDQAQRVSSFIELFSSDAIQYQKWSL